MTVATKSCIRCGQDCSGRPRIKDTQGRYTCKACLKPEELARIDAVQVAKPQSKPKPRPVEVAPPPEPEDNLALSLADLEGDSGSLVEQAVCPACQSSVPHGGQICVQCGFNLATGIALATRSTTDDEDTTPNLKPGRAKCQKCGYDMAGLKKPRCPECGTLVLAPTYRDKIKEDSARTARWAYIKPVIQFAIGAAITLAFLAGNNKTDLIPVYSMAFGIQVAAGVAAFFLCCLLFLGFDAPMHLTALRLAGVYALVDAASNLLSYVPIPIVGYAILLFLYIGLLAESLELDVSDAIMVGVVTFGIRVIIGIAIISYIISNQ